MRERLPYLLFPALLCSCSALWMGTGAPLPELLEKTRAEVEAGQDARELTGAPTRKDRTELEKKLTRVQPLKGTKAGDFHWAALGTLLVLEGLPEWAVKLEVEATMLTPEGLAARDQKQSEKKEDKKEDPSGEKPKEDKKKEKEKGPSYEGIEAKIELVRNKTSEPWRLADLGLDAKGPRFSFFVKRPPFSEGAPLSATEANDNAFDTAFLAPAPPFSSLALLSGLAGAVAAGDSDALLRVANVKGKQEELSALLKSLSSKDLQGILKASPAFLGLPAGTVELKVNLRGAKGQKLSYTIKKTKEGYRVTELKVRETKDSTEVEL